MTFEPIFDCSKCGEPIEADEPVVIVFHGVMTDPNSSKPPYGLDSEGAADRICHACCWDGIDDDDWDTASRECVHGSTQRGP